MSALPKPFMTPEQYLEIERRADFKSEYHSGQMFAMAGGSQRHSAIGTNIVGELRNRLRGSPCQPFNSDLRVLVPATGLYTYPDASVVCGEQKLQSSEQDNLTNPKVIFEVLSASTEAYDRGAKFALYQRLESLQEYVLVSQDTPRVERYVRQEGGRWLYEQNEGLEAAVALETLGIALPLTEIYDRVAFAATDVGTMPASEPLGEHNR